MARLDVILTPDELALYQAYRQRLEAAVSQQDPDSIAIRPSEQAVLDTIAADTLVELQSRRDENGERW